MKFGKRLQHQIEETLPEWRDKFLRYKDLKKLVKLVASAPRHGYEKAQRQFVYLLNVEMDKFNGFFVEQEEDFVIRHKELQQRIQKVNVTSGTNGSQPSEADYKVGMERIRKELINFHGEMVLLENYSNINYTGLAKILKKYDKRTGGLLRLPFIQKVLEQPFFTTNLVSKLVKECERAIDTVFPSIEVKKKTDGKERKTSSGVVGESIFRSTVAALATMQEMRRGSSTYGHFSLPPLSLPDFDTSPELQLNSSIAIP